jgi:hypothetical protein
MSRSPTRTSMASTAWRSRMEVAAFERIEDTLKSTVAEIEASHSRGSMGAGHEATGISEEVHDRCSRYGRY